MQLAHLGVNAICRHREFIHKAEVLKPINPLFGFGIRADDRATLKGIENLGGMEAQHTQITVL